MTETGHSDRRDKAPARRSTRNRPTDTGLLDAACAVIAEVGVDRATMDSIAQRADTSRVTLYAHFGSRDALIDAVIERELAALTTWMFEIYDNGETMRYGQRARYSIESLFDYARRHPEGFRVLLDNRYDDGHPGRRLSAALEPRIAERLRANYAERGTPINTGADTLATMLLGISLDVAYRAVILAGADIGAACDLAVTASLAVLRSVDPEQLRAIDTRPPPTP
ncbi:TetR family transcriptional regulator [Nocardia mangyaensis]|uniref:TetR family transcriptional regulator n=1 Tax=Nocardia mangyaensis TaxID=2213200 RepID=A0A1J0VRW6_9NOCA|nr:TetR/AcrR family transcriptional regulator [Nocardia mangyaensis]APE34774.1 TetR family transcriptional regulator [Nocardia mangyaensis]